MSKVNKILKECKKHGNTEFYYENRGSYRCGKCRSERVSKNRRDLKDWAIKSKGGKCSICGYSKSSWSLDFHHLRDKEFIISTLIRNRKRILLEKELEKCVLVCSNCHGELEEQKYLGTVAE